jgi:5'-3' exonuclease
MQQLIFDCNYLLHKNVRTLHKHNTLYGDLYKALCLNIEKYTRMHNFSRIYFVSDSGKKSWRTQESTIYKGNREQDEDIDWKWVYKTYDEWKLDMKEKYNVVQRPHIEGDDWIAVLIRKGNAKGWSSVVIASDRDMLQLVGYRLKGEKSYINIQIDDKNGSEKVFLPEGWEIFVQEYDNLRSNDIFNLDDGHSWVSFLNRVSRNYDKVEVNNFEKLFCKIVEGDKGDNINSIHLRPQKKNPSKMRRIGPKGALKVWNFYKENYKPIFSTDEETFPDDLINSYQKTHKLSLTDQEIDNIKEKIHQNIVLMELHHKHYPEWVMEEIADELTDKM